MALRHPQSLIETLTQIQKVASSISHQLETAHNIPPPQTPAYGPQTIVPDLNLHIPYGLLAPIEQLNVPETLRRDILAVFERNLNQLHQQYRSTYERAYLVNTASGFKTDVEILQNIYRSLYHNQAVPMIKSQVSFVLEELAKHQRPRSHDHKRPFNAKYSTVLEKYFEVNGYPSVAHRQVLAQKSGMTPRQIEVWFQNHRNRAKKEGKVICRLDSDFPLKQALTTLQDCISTGPTRMLTPPAEESNNVKPQASKTLLAQQSLHTITERPPTFLDDSYSLRPSHAYPATWNCSYPDPFQNTDGVFTFPPPTWRRKPASVSIVPKAVDMDEFANTFHLKLNFSENSRRRGTTPLELQPCSVRPWFAATTTTFTSPAPHPALLRTRSTLQPTSLVTIPSLSFEPTFGSKSFPVIISHISSPREAIPRKLKPLPRRTPSQTPSSTFGSRSSSFSSDISTSGQSSSSPSDYSSPEPSTPPSLPHVDLPVVQVDTQQQELFDFSRTDLDSEDIFSSFFPSQDFNLFDPNFSNKFSDTLLDRTFADFGQNYFS